MALLLHIDWMGWGATSLIILMAVLISFAAARSSRARNGQKRTGEGNRRERRAEQSLSRRKR